MPTFIQHTSGHWRAVVRRKRAYASKTFRLKADAERWAREQEDRADRGQSVSPKPPANPRTVGDLIQLHRADLAEVGKALGRSKRFTLEKLEAELGNLKHTELTRERLIAFAKGRRKEGAGPVTIATDLSYLRTVVVHAAAVHGIEISAEPIKMARGALNLLGLVGKANERDRRPTQEELDRIVANLDNNARQIIPVGRIVRFAVASAMRISEITNLDWDDLETAKRIILVRDRKDPRKKQGNNQRVPLIDITGYDALAIIEEQARATNRHGKIFPYCSRSAGTAFRRACLQIHDLHFHDLRHEATSRLFEAGLQIPEVPLITGHKDWKMLRRYLHLKPEQVAAKAMARGRAAGEAYSASEDIADRRAT